MNKGVVIIGFVFLLVVIGAIFVYVLYEKPVTEEGIKYTNLSFRILDNSTNRNIQSGYVIADEYNNIYSSGISLTDGYVLITLPQNMSFYLYSNNTQYYNEVSKINSFSEVQTIEMELNKIGVVNISYNSLLNISSKGLTREPKICIRWSKNFIGVYLNATEYNVIPQRLKNKVDRCYSISSINNNETLLTLTYKKFGNLNDLDFINVYLIDSDYGIFAKNLRTEDNNGNDIAMEDASLIIKGF